jgi:hypothetical protein
MCDPKDYDMTPVTATLHFDLESAAGERRLKECLDAPELKAVILELDDWLRSLPKYHDVFSIDVSEVRERIGFILEGHGIDIWED